VTDVVASLLVEKLVEAASMGLLALPIALLAELPSGLGAAISSLAFLAVAGVAALVVVSWRFGREGKEGRTGRLLHRLGRALRLMRAPSAWLGALAFSLFSDLIDVAMIGFCLLAVDVRITPLAWCVTYLAINLAIALPTTPGQIGVLEAAATLVLTALGVPSESALAFALVYHGAHIIPSTAAGLYSLHRIAR
jgi:uncharacterized membrane protein YbhN (UPF0104 family)